MLSHCVDIIHRREIYIEVGTVDRLLRRVSTSVRSLVASDFIIWDVEAIANFVRSVLYLNLGTVVRHLEI